MLDGILWSFWLSANPNAWNGTKVCMACGILASIVYIWKACDIGSIGYEKHGVSSRSLILYLSKLSPPSANFEIPPTGFGTLAKIVQSFEPQQRFRNTQSASFHTAKLKEKASQGVTFQACDLHLKGGSILNRRTKMAS